MIRVIEDLLETLYSYQQSIYYRVHLIAIVVVGILLANVIVKEWKMRKEQEERPISKCSSKVPYFEYVTNRQKTTQEALNKLENSREYKQYLLDKQNPYSKYNMKKDEEVSEIYLSDDSDEDAGHRKRS